MSKYHFLEFSELELKTYLNKVSDSFNLFHDEIPMLTERDDVFNKVKIKESVTFFGGSFHPIHEGHLECLRQCPEKNIVVVLDHNPQKDLRNLQLKSDLENIVNNLKDFQVSIFPGFWISNDKNPTANWITKVKIPVVNLLMGDDSFMSFFTWIEPEKILSRISKIYVVPRSFDQKKLDQQILKMKKINTNLEVVVLNTHPFQDLSSTKMRNKKE